MNKLFLWLLLGLVLPCFAGEIPVGRMWGNIVKDVTEEEPAAQKLQGVPFNQLSYTERAKVLNFYTMEALHKAQFTHSVEDMRAFIAFQDYWLRESSIYGKVFQQAMLENPAYDYSVTHPTSSIGLKLTDELRTQKRQLAIKKIAKTHGVLFFYRGKNTFDRRQLPIIRDFCSRFNLTLLPIVVDGELSDEFDNARIDNGQAEALGVRFFPGMLLINPQTQEVKPLAYGLITQDVLEQRFFSVLTKVSA